MKNLLFNAISFVTLSCASLHASELALLKKNFGPLAQYSCVAGSLLSYKKDTRFNRLPDATKNAFKTIAHFLDSSGETLLDESLLSKSVQDIGDKRKWCLKTKFLETAFLAQAIKDKAYVDQASAKKSWDRHYESMSNWYPSLDEAQGNYRKYGWDQKQLDHLGSYSKLVLDGNKVFFHQPEFPFYARYGCEVVDPKATPAKELFSLARILFYGSFYKESRESAPFKTFFSYQQSENEPTHENIRTIVTALGTHYKGNNETLQQEIAGVLEFTKPKIRCAGNCG
jgi:hypothetical protein